MSNLFLVAVAQEFGLPDLESEVAPGWSGRDAIDTCLKEEGDARLVKALDYAAAEFDVLCGSADLETMGVDPSLLARALYEGLNPETLERAIGLGLLNPEESNTDLASALTDDGGIRYYNEALEHKLERFEDDRQEKAENRPCRRPCVRKSKKAVLR